MMKKILILENKKKRKGWFYCLPPLIAPKIANNAKNNATGRIPITVHAVSLASSHSVVPKLASPIERPAELSTSGQSIASDTSENIRIPIISPTAAPMKAIIKPSDSMLEVCC